MIAMETIERELADLRDNPNEAKERTVLNQLWALIGEMKADRIESNPPPGWEELQTRANARPQ